MSRSCQARCRWGGPSPCWRGDRALLRRAARTVGTIPALAGRPGPPARGAGRPPDYPRAGGETYGPVNLSRACGGPSPRWRGDLIEPLALVAEGGTIPALAGRPHLARPPCPGGGDHPRAGGETLAARRPRRASRGPSPRWRGDLEPGEIGSLDLRTIPALAGRPTRTRITSSRRWDHPRAGGETRRSSRRTVVVVGPSPRWRGDRALRRTPRRRARTIPALAGRPRRAQTTTWRSGDHPRAGGETGDPAAPMVWREGPSPRWRGDPARSRARSRAGRTIPALAGRPRRARHDVASQSDHPRAGGETDAVQALDSAVKGPSPRWRGDPQGRPGRRLGGGPSPRWRGDRAATGIGACRCRTIPALAGRPDRAPRTTGRARDHPRAGGETDAVGRLAQRGPGPSPRWRGDPRRRGRGHGVVGTIPALAGRPFRRSGPLRAEPDHPRAGGETLPPLLGQSGRAGPSPRWRGDHSGAGLSPGLPRTIPALAGRPRCPGPRRTRSRDHPRAGGETRPGRPGARAVLGPSPRWRGDLTAPPRMIF